MAVNKIRPRKLNATADSRMRKMDEMQDAVNLVSTNDFRASGETTEGNDSTGNAGVLKPCRGNQMLPSLDTAGAMFGTGNENIKRVLGSVTDHENNVIYFFLWHAEAGKQGVYAYDVDGFLPGVEGNNGFKKIFTSNQFNFPSNGFVKGDIVKLSVPFDYGDVQYESQPVLYFTDNTNEPRKLHPFRALTEVNDLNEYSSIDIKDFITACPKTPMHAIKAEFLNDIQDPTSAFEGLPGFQFAYQHLYKGGEESALSTFSDIAVPPAYFTQGSSTVAYLSSNNKCELTIPRASIYIEPILDENGDSTGVGEQVGEVVGRTKEIKEIRILARIGNRGVWKVVEEVPAPEGEDLIYHFYNRRIFGGLSRQDALKPFDNIPQKAQAQAVVSDRLCYANYVEGYDNVKVEAKATIEYHERPDDFGTLEIKVTPTIMPHGDEKDGYKQQNKRSGYHIDCSGIPNFIGAESVITLSLFIRPNRNFHLYNSYGSFHGSRHLSLDVGEEQEQGSLSVEGPEVWGGGPHNGDSGDEGPGASIDNTCSNITHIEHLDKMFGRNLGIGVLNSEGQPALRWKCTNSQREDSVGSSHKAVYGTSAANPFILRGASLEFNVRMQVDGVLEDGDGLHNAQVAVRDAIISVLSGDNSFNFDESSLTVLSSKSEPSYFINEGLSAGNAGTSKTQALSSAHRIPVMSGDDDRKHLIWAVGSHHVIKETNELDDMVQLTPQGYCIVNKANATWGMNNIGNGFLELDLRSLDDIEILTAIPFIDGEFWKDSAYEARSGEGACGIVDDGNNDRNYGVRDATYWSLDSLMVDSWYCFGEDYMLGANIPSKLFTPTPTDFPRYLNQELTEGNTFTGTVLANPGSLNPACTGGGEMKNAAVLNVLEAFGGYNDGLFDSDVWRIRSRGDAAFWGQDIGCGNEFEQWHIAGFLKICRQYQDDSSNTPYTTSDPNGRLRMVGYLKGDVENDLLDLDKDGTSANSPLGGGDGISIVDGAIGPGSAPGGGENLRKMSGATEAYAIGSVSGEMIFTGRIGPRGYFLPNKLKQGLKHQANLYDRLWKPYGQGQMLPYLGGRNYMFGAGLAKGYIYNFKKHDGGPDTTEEEGLYHIQDYKSYLPFRPYAHYLGHYEDNSNTYISSSESAVAELFVSAKIGDAQISAVETEARVIDSAEVKIGGRSFKTRATHAFGIVYYDERGRSGDVNPITFTTLRQGLNSEEKAVNSQGIYVKGYSNEERSNKGRISVNIELQNDPPPWAHHYQLVYGGNTTKGNFIQYTTGGACIANLNQNELGTDEGEDPSSTNIYVSLNYLQGNRDVSYSEAFGAVSPEGLKDLYVYKEGDKLRVISYYTSEDNRVWPHDVEFDILGVENVSADPEKNIFREAYELGDDNNLVASFRTGQYLVLRNNPRSEGFNYSSVKEAKNAPETNSHFWNNICVVEIYSPAKASETEDRLFFETGKMYDVGRDNQGNPYHKTNFITLNKGDVWFRRGAVAIPEFGSEQEDASGEPLESFGKFKNLLKKGIGDGGNSPRFKDYYVESMTFNDTFAGNNVYNKGKPKAIRPDEEQVRKRSSIIYSDKHNFSRRNIKFTSFNQANMNFKDLPGEYGRINYLQNNFDSLLCIQENKTSTVPVERNILSDASGSESLIKTEDIIGVQAFFAGEYGCDNNPESVQQVDGATYFASKAKSEVYKQTSKGIAVISDIGLKSYFYRIFEEAKERQANGQGKIYIPSGFDPLKNEFLITVGNLTHLPTSGGFEYTQPNLGDVTEEKFGVIIPPPPVVDEEEAEESTVVIASPDEFIMQVDSWTDNFYISSGYAGLEFDLFNTGEFSSNITGVSMQPAGNVNPMFAGMFDYTDYVSLESFTQGEDDYSWNSAGTWGDFPSNSEVVPNAGTLQHHRLKLAPPDFENDNALQLNTLVEGEEYYIDESGNGVLVSATLITISFDNAPDEVITLVTYIPFPEENQFIGANFVTSITAVQPLGGSTSSSTDVTIEALSEENPTATYFINIENQGNVDGSFSIPSYNGFNEEFYTQVLGGGIEYRYDDGDYSMYTYEDSGSQSGSPLEYLSLPAGQSIELKLNINYAPEVLTEQENIFSYLLEFSQNTPQIMQGTPLSYEGNLVINTAVTTTLAGDLNQDGIVDTNDLLNFLSQYGGIGDDLTGDLDGDGAVSTTDLLELLSTWGQQTEVTQGLDDVDEDP